MHDVRHTPRRVHDHVPSAGQGLHGLRQPPVHGHAQVRGHDAPWCVEARSRLQASGVNGRAPILALLPHFVGGMAWTALAPRGRGTPSQGRVVRTAARHPRHDQMRPVFVVVVVVVAVPEGQKFPLKVFGDTAWITYGAAKARVGDSPQRL